MWELRHPISQDVDDTLTDTSSFNSDKMSTSHSLDSAPDLLELEEDHPSINSTGGSTIPPLQYTSYRPLVMNPNRRDDGSSTQSFQPTTETVMDSDVLLKTWVDYGPGPVNLSNLFPGTPNFFHTLQKPDTPTNTASTLLLPSQHDTPCTNNTDEVNNGNPGDFNNAMGELATLMLGCSLLLNEADNDTETWLPTQPGTSSTSNMNRPTTTTTTSAMALNISKAALPSFDFDFSLNNASSPTNDSASSSRRTAVTKLYPSPTGFQFPATANPRQDQDQDQQQQPHNGSTPSPFRDIKAEPHPSSTPTSQRKILPLPKRRLKGTQLHHEPTAAPASPQPIPTYSLFTFRSPTVPIQKSTEGGSSQASMPPIIHNASPCDYTKKPKRHETCYTDQGDSTLQRKQNSRSITTSNAPPPLARPPSPSSSSSTLPNFSSPNQQHTPSPSTSSTQANLQQRPSPEKKKKKKAKGKSVSCTSSSSTTTTSSNYRQTKPSRPRRRQKNQPLDTSQPGGQTNSGPLDIINTTDDWICLFCQYQIFKGGWTKQKKKGRPSGIVV
ncbi:hypothetical protein [Absidia glauca]|uniref:Uncharacterized protein n=1 Tax=Absidia glauca TaxID=4829 RepID=A0A168Q7J0_ABSGL|nr:hypothetical protein [Absidia glauca]